MTPESTELSEELRLLAEVFAIKLREKTQPIITDSVVTLLRKAAKAFAPVPPTNHGEPVTELFAWITTDATGRAGVAAVDNGKGKMLPMVSPKREIAILAKTMAQQLSSESALRMRLLRYTLVEQIDETTP